MPARIKVAALIAFVLCFSLWPSGKFFAQEKEGTVALHITSPDFSDGEVIPKRFTCDAQDVSPKLEWKGPPANTESFALIMDDPDAPAGTWVHWVLYDVPADARELPERLPSQEQLANGARQGRNDFGKIGFGGPHRYFFKLYALDMKLNLKPSVTKVDLERAMKSHIVAQAELIGKYGR